MLAAAAAAAAAAAGIDPSHAVNITVYHVNPRHLGAIPINMDTGNSMGDLYFDMQAEVPTALNCRMNKSMHGCENQEVVGRDLAVNKLTLEVDSRYSGYAMCNIGVNGTDGYGDPCKNDTYCCVCRDTHDWRHLIPCNDTLGRESPPTAFGAYYHCDPGDPTYLCYQKNVIRYFSGNDTFWYSSLKKGMCAAGSDAPCTWRVVAVEKIVNRTCHKNSFYSAIESRGSGCFASCGPGPRNESSSCWVDCIYATVLGPDAGVPGGAVSGGIPIDELERMWTAPFRSDSPAEGGCPGLPEWK